MFQAVDSFITGLIIGSVGTCLGGIISLFTKKQNDRVFSSLFMFTAGLMLSIVSFDLLPESQAIGGNYVLVLGLINGVIIIFLVEELLPIKKMKIYNKSNVNYIKMGLMILISMSLHNLPEGLALGSSYIYSEKLGIKIGILIAFHNIPEGLSIGIPLVLAGFSPFNVISLTLLAGFPTAIGAFIGSIFGNLSNYFIGYCLSSAASTMLYVICGELIPEASKLYKGRTNFVSLLFGFIVGCILSFQV